jgi:hypothetical protein
VPARDALTAAHALALRALLEQEPEDERRQRLERAILQVEER